MKEDIFDNKSSNEIIMSRCTRNPLLPTQIHKLKPHVIDHRKFSTYLDNNQKKQTDYYNKKKGAKKIIHFTAKYKAVDPI
jgi:hypothetical protein